MPASLTHRTRRWHGTALLLLLATALQAHAQSRAPQLGYIYPSGAQQGTTIRATIGGQYLSRPTAIHLSGKGIRTTVIKKTQAFRRLNTQRRYLLVQKLWDAQDHRLKRDRHHIDDIKAFQELLQKRPPWNILKREVDTEGYHLQEHAMLSQLDQADLPTIHHIQRNFFFPRNKIQANRQLAEHLVIEIQIAPNAPLGLHELRLLTPNGLSNPLRFQVDTLPEKRELEPNDEIILRPSPFPKGIAEALAPRTHDLPFVMNGQIMPGDIDTIRFRAFAGQKLAARAYARELIPYLADAVPGWFQAVITLYDDTGRELAFADDAAIDPDPTLTFTIPTNGVYVLSIRDAIYRGRQDFSYRLTLTEPSHPAPPKPPIVPDLIVKQPTSLQKPREVEPNNVPAQAQWIRQPHLLSGAISFPGDVDLFRIEGRTNHRIVAETYARRLDSPLDALLRLLDANGNVIAWNDDSFLKSKHLHIDHVGLTTHHADAYLSATFPRNGTYFIQLSDAQGHGSKEHRYHLRIAPPQPGFALRISPSGIAAPRGGSVPISVHVIRQDGFDGPITLKLFDEPAGTSLSGATIPAGDNHARFTLTMPQKATEEIIPIRIQGTAKHENGFLRRMAVPADNLMQAFLWRHLVPAQQLLFTTTKGWTPVPPLKRSRSGAVSLTPNKPTKVVLHTSRPPSGRREDVYTLHLDDPPPGVTLVEKSTHIRPREWEFKLLYTPTPDTPPLKAQNIIIQVAREYTPKQREGAPKAKRRQDRVGYLPAIPIRLN
jgi:hypothetical protein